MAKNLVFHDQQQKNLSLEITIVFIVRQVTIEF